MVWETTKKISRGLGALTGAYAPIVYHRYSHFPKTNDPDQEVLFWISSFIQELPIIVMGSQIGYGIAEGIYNFMDRTINPIKSLEPEINQMIQSEAKRIKDLYTLCAYSTSQP